MNSQSAFVLGCADIQIESIRNHEKATGHCHLVRATKVAENPHLASLPLFRGFNKSRLPAVYRRLSSL